MKRKIIALCLIVAMLGVAVVGSTLAYFTDSEQATNVFTVGNIDIELDEDVAVLDKKNGTEIEGKLFESEDGVIYRNIMPTNYLKKQVKVTNLENPAYVRVTVIVNNMYEINQAIDEYYEDKGWTEAQIQDVYDDVFDDWNWEYTHTNRDGDNDMRDTIAVLPDVMPWSSSNPKAVLTVDTTQRVTDYCMVSVANWFRNDNDPINGAYTTDGRPDTINNYYGQFLNEYEACFTYYMYLEKGENVTLFQGLRCPSYFNQEQAKMFQDLKIEVYADAIQAESFAKNDPMNKDNAMAAFNALNATHNLSDVRANSNWDAGLGSFTFVEDEASLKDALKNGDDVAITEDMPKLTSDQTNGYGKTALNQLNGGVIDGLGNTIGAPKSTSTWDSAINTTGGTIRNLTINKGFRGIFVNHNGSHSERVILENVTIDGPTYTISCDQGKNQGLTATNSTFNGWTSYAATIGDVKFVDCSFGEGAGYAYCRPYAPTSFVGCDFEAGYEIDPCAAVTFANCTIGGQPLTAANLGTLIDAYYGDAANATVIG